MPRRLVWLVALVLTLGLVPARPAAAVAPPFGDPAMETVWRRTDQPVASQAVSRTWLWGPAPVAGLYEPYDQAPGGWRLVQYYDKSRMEVTTATGDRSSAWFVTNGLLSRELITGQLQLGDARHADSAPAAIPVAGDADDPSGPTYATFTGLLGAREPRSGPVIDTLDRRGTVGQNPALGGHTDYAQYVPETGHTIPRAFWDYLTSDGLVQTAGGTATERLFDPTFFATGYPITEAYWARVKVGGAVTDVLVQAYERRVLTYTPSNDPAWRVEMGNIGQHYYRWRYGEAARGLQPGTVTRVVDGDTIDVSLGGQVQRVRLIGVNTPETVDPRTGVECYGPEASAATKGLLEGKPVLLEQDVSTTDRYDRLLRYVYVEGLFVNDWLVRSGYAQVSTYPPDVKYTQGLLEAERYARASSTGLWGNCGSDSPPPAEPTPTPVPGQPGAGCDPSYPTVCIPPPPPDLDCADIAERRFPVLPPDPHRLDRDGNGIGCES